MFTLPLTPNSIDRYAEAEKPGWQVWSERGRGNIKVQAFSSRDAACRAFDSEVVSRILVDPLDREDRSSLGLNRWALARVRTEHTSWSEKGMLTIEVEINADQSRIFVLPSRATVGDLKAKVCNDWAVPAATQTLLHHGIVVKDPCVLSSLSCTKFKLAREEDCTESNIENTDADEANIGTTESQLQFENAIGAADDDGKGASCLHISTVGGLPVFAPSGRTTDTSLWPPQLDIDSVVAAMSASGATSSEHNSSPNLSPHSTRAACAAFGGLTLSWLGSPVQTPAGSRAPSTDSARSDASMQEAQKLVANMFSSTDSRRWPKRGRSARRRQSTPGLASALISPQCLDTPPERFSRDSAPAACGSSSAPVGRYRPPTPLARLQPLNGSMPHFPPVIGPAPSERNTGGARSRQGSLERRREA